MLCRALPVGFVILVSLSWACSEGHPQWRPSRQEQARTARQERLRARPSEISTPAAGGRQASTTEITPSTKVKNLSIIGAVD